MRYWIRPWPPTRMHTRCSIATGASHIRPRCSTAGMTQNMSRVGKCIDNGPMEGFWGILKRERYYGRKFTSRELLCRIIREFIAYYNFSRLQRQLGVHTPMEVFTQYRAA
ncbi:IS3 family transposase [Oscillospiraceae bacterium 38-13]